MGGGAVGGGVGLGVVDSDEGVDLIVGGSDCSTVIVFNSKGSVCVAEVML